MWVTPTRPQAGQSIGAGMVPARVHVAPPFTVVRTSVQVGWPQVGTSTSAQPWTGLIQVRSSTTTWAGGRVVVVVGDERTVVVAALCGAVPWERGAVEHAVKAAATASRVTTSCLLIR